MAASFLESAGTLLTILTPLVAVPLTVITFYLRSLREHQISRHLELVRRVELVEAAVANTRKSLSEFERDYTTKEEWLRECMLARRTLEQLQEATVRMETTIGSFEPDRAVQPTRSAGRVRDDAANQASAGNSGRHDESDGDA